MGPGEGTAVFVWRDETGLTEALRLVDTVDVEGIHSIAIDPEYMQNSHVWVFYLVQQPDPSFSRLSRFTNVNDTLVNEEVILEGPLKMTRTHPGGCIAFDSQNRIFLGFGDDAQGSATSQDPFDLHGTLLRINRDGTPAAGNPFLDGVAADPRVYAYGLRQPFSCAMEPGLQDLFIGDVGNIFWEEIDIAVAGANYGWALTEGPVPPGVPGVTYPIYSYDHPTDNAAVVMGDFVEPGEFNPDYEGNLFFADASRSQILRMELDENQNPVEVEVWADDANVPVALSFGPDGALYYAARHGGSEGRAIKRIEYVGGANRQPTARAAALPDSGPAPLAVTLDGAASADPDDDPLTHDWDLGDGGSDTGEVVVHNYPQGVFDVVLTVDDGQGLTDNAPPLRIVSGNIRPTVGVTSPPSGLTYNAGDTINFVGTGTDAEEGPLGCSQFTWQIVFRHGNHGHPYLGPLQGSCSGSFTTATQGETAPDVSYEVRLDVADTGVPLGSEAVLTGTAIVEVEPNLAIMTFKTAPRTDLILRLDTQPITAPLAVQGVVNLSRTIEAIEQLAPDGHTYVWQSWSDGGTIEHEISTPAVDTDYTATFVCDMITEVDGLLLGIDRGSGEVSLLWTSSGDSCLSGYRIYGADTSTPAALPPSFPDDPVWTLLGTPVAPPFVDPTGSADRYFLVSGQGTDGERGPVDHYGCSGTALQDDPDGDGDGICDDGDNCPSTPNFDQQNTDADGFGDVCDTCLDVDGDGLGDGNLNNAGCPDATTDSDDMVQTICADTDGDGCDDCSAGTGFDPANDGPDGDADGVCDLTDNCPSVPNAGQENDDSDPAGDACDTCTDADNDQVGNGGLGNVGCVIPDVDLNDHQSDKCTDTDGDGCDDCSPTQTFNPNNDGPDADSDGICDSGDNCPDTSNPDQADSEGGPLVWLAENQSTIVLTTLGATHPVTAGLTGSGLSGWGDSQHNIFTQIAGLAVLATDPSGQANLLSGTLGSGRLIYSGIHPTGHQPQGESQDLIRQAVLWANQSAGTIDVLWVGPETDSWNTGIATVVQTSGAAFATQSLTGFDVIYVDGQANAPSVLSNRSGDIADFVSSGGGLITDNGGGFGSPDFSWVPLFAGVAADGIGNVCDNCPTVNNPSQIDTDEDGIGDACE